MAADVGEVERTSAAGTRCGQCSAAVRPSAPWCTQCYAPVGTTVATADHDVPPASAGGLRLAERAESAPAVPTSSGTWPCGACSQPNDLALAACAGCGTPFLAAVRDDRPTVVLPVVGDVLELTPARRLGLAVCTVLLFLLITCALALLLA